MRIYLSRRVSRNIEYKGIKHAPVRMRMGKLMWGRKKEIEIF